MVPKSLAQASLLINLELFYVVDDSDSTDEDDDSDSTDGDHVGRKSKEDIQLLRYDEEGMCLFFAPPPSKCSDTFVVMGVVFLWWEMLVFGEPIWWLSVENENYFSEVL